MCNYRVRHPSSADLAANKGNLRNSVLLLSRPKTPPVTSGAQCGAASSFLVSAAFDIGHDGLVTTNVILHYGDWTYYRVYLYVRYT